MMSTSYSPARMPLGGGGGMSRLRSSSSKKPPEPLRRAVADSLSTTAQTNLEASRTLRDYLATHTTIDLTYNVILEHTLAEKERSPAVVAKCVALLKRHLLRYKPNEETLLQIDRFCLSIIYESRSSSQQSGAVPSTPVHPLPVSCFATGALVKSLNYIRSLVSQYLPRRSFQPAAFAGAPSASRQSLPTLSSLLSRSFSSHLNPTEGKESLDSKDASVTSVSESPIVEEGDEIEDQEFISIDVFRWRWCTEQSSLLLPKSEINLNSQDAHSRNFLEVGAAALLVGDMEAKMKGETWRIFGSADMRYLDQLLQPSLLTTVTNSASSFAHLRAITALKRSKPGTNQTWEDLHMSTFRPRTRPLFQYRYYSEQQPLRLNPVEICEVIAVVHKETISANSNHSTVSSKLRAHGRPSMDVAVSVLVKLVIDMYVLDSEAAAPLTLFMLEDMLMSPITMSRTRVFDIILNLGVHSHLMEPPVSEGPSIVDEVYSREVYFENGDQLSSHMKSKSDKSKMTGNSPAIDKFECWILGILFEVLLHLVQIEEKEESVWASSLSCLLYFVCDRGKIRKSRLKDLDIRVIKELMQVSRKNSWAQIVHCKLACMMTNMFYENCEAPEKEFPTTPSFIVKQVDLIGGIDFIFVEFVLSSSREERRNLFLVLFDYVLHQINEACAASGVSEYSDDEVRSIATLLILADAPEALHISVKLGVEGIVELLRRSVSSALSTYPNNDQLVVILEKIVETFDNLIRSFTHVNKEFNQMIQVTKSFKYIASLGEALGSIALNAKLSWTTLHSLLHSEQTSCRHNGYLWLGDLLISEISEEGDLHLWSSIKNLEKMISLAAVNEYSADLDVPMSIWLMCGLLKSKNKLIRWGFLFVLERLLIRCKFLLDESEVQHGKRSDSIEHTTQTRLEKANNVIDVMSCALSLMAQINETDRMNILKMCDILFSQLCLKVVHANGVPFGDKMLVKDSNSSEWNSKKDGSKYSSLLDNIGEDDFGGDTKLGNGRHFPNCETASMAALLLHGQAILPMQLVARVPAALFYWPLIQLAGAATDNIALGVSVGSNGRGNLAGGTSDIRATLLLLLIGKCTADPAAFTEVGGEEFFRGLLDDTDARVAYYSSMFLLKRMMTEEPESYQRMLQSLILKAQQSNNEKLLENPYLQMRGLLQLSNE